MLSAKLLIPAILTLLISTAQSATIPEVIAANSDLTYKTNTADAFVVSIDATTPAATKQVSLSIRHPNPRSSLTLSPTTNSHPPPTVAPIIKSHFSTGSTRQIANRQSRHRRRPSLPNTHCNYRRPSPPVPARTLFWKTRQLCTATRFGFDPEETVYCAGT